jgi:hypothetical protein
MKAAAFTAVKLGSAQQNHATSTGFQQRHAHPTWKMDSMQRAEMSSQFRKPSAYAAGGEDVKA